MLTSLSSIFYRGLDGLRRVAEWVKVASTGTWRLDMDASTLGQRPSRGLVSALMTPVSASVDVQSLASVA